jgi:hypothetical protein
MLDLYAIYVLYFGYGSWCLFGLLTLIIQFIPDKCKKMLDSYTILGLYLGIIKGKKKRK